MKTRVSRQLRSVAHGPGRKLVLGLTLPELMVTVGVGSLVLLGVMMVFMTSARSFAAMSNYVTMDQASRSAVDQMTRDIRKSKDLVSFATDQLVFKYSSTNNLTYKYDASSKQLLSWTTGGSTNSLLTDCDSVQFTMYKNAPGSGGNFNTTTTVSQ